MRRSGKCVGKRAFAYVEHAEAQVIKNYAFRRPTLGIYECPTCLDFHLTSKYDNRNDKLKKKCKKIAAQFHHLSLQHTHEFALRWFEKKLRNHRNLAIPKIVTPSKDTPPNPNSNSSKAKKKKREYKASIVPLAEQRRIFQQLDNKKLSTPRSFWARILGIIKVS